MDDQVEVLKRELAETRAAFDVLASGQIDSITDPGGPLLVRQAQEALRRSEGKFRSLIEQLPDLVWVHRNGRLVYANPITLHCLGYADSDALVGRPMLDWWVAEVSPLSGDRSRAVSYQGHLRRKDGGVAVIEITDQRVVFDGEPAILTVGHDVTGRKRLEAQLQVSHPMAPVGMLAAGVAHEINNPLTFVIANLQFVAAELARCTQRVPEEAKHLGELQAAVSDAQDGAERVRAIVGDLKALSRSDEGKSEAVNVQQLLNSTVHLAENEIRHCAQLVKDYGEADLQVEGNAARLSQVFLNLLLNAAQAIPDGASDQNVIRLRARPEPDGRILIEVGDTGIGMSSETRARLFTPFFTTKAKGGTGLGLSICQKIVAAHGGEIQVKSEVGQGTTFRVWLPAAVHAASDRSAVALKPGKPRDGKRGRVLIVDDEPMVGAVLQRLLTRDHHAEVANSGKDALARIAVEAPFDVIFCDMMMPDMTGPQFFDALSVLNAQLAKRIVFMTGGVFTDKGRAFLEQTANPTMDKPFDPDQLRSIVAKLVDR